tara:strand:- start:10173 stop:10346 length:174 start_codon:yes stop_codon:yes gene_type:complete
LVVIGVILDVTNVRVKRAAVILESALKAANVFVLVLSNQESQGEQKVRRGASLAALF